MREVKIGLDNVIYVQCLDIHALVNPQYKK